MNRTPRLSISGIEYLDYSWGIWSGCRNHQNGVCPVKNCWAKGIALHFPKLYPNGFEPAFYPEAINSPKYIRKPSIISVGWVGDIIGYCHSVSERSLIYQTILQCPHHIFMFLTKNPENLPLWSPFPDNCWVGVTITEAYPGNTPLAYLAQVEASVKYISFEPLLKWGTDLTSVLKLSFEKAGINWVIIGAQTKPTIYPENSWIKEIVQACDKAGIPVFLKDNLKPLFSSGEPTYWAIDNSGFLRQEMPGVLCRTG